MSPDEVIDVSFDFRSDTPPGKDPDSHSPTLRMYHRILWSKPLPSGRSFDLDVTTPRTYLHHGSELGEFGLSSDAVIPTFKWTELVRDQIPEEETEAFNRIGYTIGGMMAGDSFNGIQALFHPSRKLIRSVAVDKERSMRPEEEPEEQEEGGGDESLRAYEIDEDTVRVNNPDPDEPDKIIRRLADGSVKSYDARKRK